MFVVVVGEPGEEKEDQGEELGGGNLHPFHSQIEIEIFVVGRSSLYRKFID